MGHVIDLVPTVLELAGLPAEKKAGPAYPGTSLNPVFKGKEKARTEGLVVGPRRTPGLSLGRLEDRIEKGQGLGIVRLGGGPDGTEGFGEFETGKGQATCGQMGKDGGWVRKGFEEMMGLSLSCGNLFG